MNKYAADGEEKRAINDCVAKVQLVGGLSTLRGGVIIHDFEYNSCERVQTIEWDDREHSHRRNLEVYEVIVTMETSQLDSLCLHWFVSSPHMQSR